MSPAPAHAWTRIGSCLSVCSQLDAFQLKHHLGRNGHATGRMPLLLAVHPQVTAVHRTGELLGPLCPSSRRGSGASGGRLPISAPMMPTQARAAAGPLRRAVALALPRTRGRTPVLRAVQSQALPVKRLAGSEWHSPGRSSTPVCARRVCPAPAATRGRRLPHDWLFFYQVIRCHPHPNSHLQDTAARTGHKDSWQGLHEKKCPRTDI